MPEGEAGEQRIQQGMRRWNVRFEISERDSRIWRPLRGEKPTQGNSAIHRLRRKLDMLKRRSQQKMPQRRG
jgi:hypothetical protein